MPLTSEIRHWTDLQTHWLHATLAAKQARRCLDALPAPLTGLLRTAASATQLEEVTYLELEASEARLASDYFLRKLLASGA
ncbi:MAG: hypothetical protein EOO28_19735 [Comamonadaceae bacterium]|nr:MAG: hypothetical protein EOO28_19735 [Comamonadaceae bacterium]